MAIKLAEAYVQIVPSMQGVGNAIVSAFDGASGKAGLSGGKAAGNGFAGGLKAKMGAVIGAASAITSAPSARTSANTPPPHKSDFFLSADTSHVSLPVWPLTAKV